MRSSRFALVSLISLVVMGLVVSGVVPFVGAQDAQIEPVGDAESGEAELSYNGQWYVRDRDVPVSVEGMQEVTDDDGNTIYDPAGIDPLLAVYVPSPTDDMAIRYLPEFVGQGDVVCPADTVSPEVLLVGEDRYIAAGPEQGVPVDQLREAGSTADGRPLWSYEEEIAPQDLLVESAVHVETQPLIRFVLVDDDSVPVSMQDQLAFAGQRFEPAPGAATLLDGLSKVGCAGLFPAYAGSEQPFPEIVLDIGGEPVTFIAIDTDEGTAAATPPSTPVTTPPSTPAATPPVVATPEPTATEIPATPEPTIVPPTETPEPTDVPATPTPDATPPPPTEAPEPTATEAPAEPTATPDVEAGDEPEALPTEVPPTPGPGTPESTLPPSRPTPTPVELEPRAVVPTLPPDAPPPAASRTTGLDCSGIVGEPDDNGVPSALPRAIQYQGSGYRYSGQVSAGDTGDASAVACAGAFTIYTVEGESALHLGLEPSPEVLYRFEPTASFTVQSQRDNQPRTIQRPAVGDQPAVTYRAGEPLVPSIYSSLSAILYVEDAEATAPDRILAYAVTGEMIGEYVPEGSAEGASQDTLDLASSAGLHSRLEIAGQGYVLVAVWTPYGTTTNGWVMLYGREGEDAPEQLAGIDPRQQELQVYNRDE